MPFNVQWYEIKDHFAAAGPIIRADVVTSRGKSKGMGTVEFADRSTAERAIQMFDRTEFKGREVFVREDLPPPEKKADYRAPPQYEDRYEPRDRYERYDSRDRYERYPPRDRFDRYERYPGGYDRYESRYERGDYAPPPPRAERRAPPAGFEVFVGNIPWSVKWQDLKDMFKPFGQVERADVFETSTGRSRGIGTVYFARYEDADAAIQKLNGFEWEGRVIEVRHGKPKGEQPDRAVTGAASTRGAIKSDGLAKNSEFTLGVTGDGPESDILYVGNLPWETAQSDLFELFGSVSTVQRAELQYGRGGNSSGNAVVQLSDVEAASNVIRQLDGYEYGNRKLRISFAKFPTPEQVAQLHAEITQSMGTSTISQAAPVDQQADIFPVAINNEAPVSQEDIFLQNQKQQQIIDSIAANAAADITEEQGAEQSAEVADDADDMIEE